MANYDITLGSAVKKLRALRGLSQSQLARMMDVDPTYVSHLERGRREPSLQVLRTMASSLQVPAATLFAIAVWHELPGGERQQFTEFVAALIEGSQLLAELE